MKSQLNNNNIPCKKYALFQKIFSLRVQFNGGSIKQRFYSLKRIENEVERNEIAGQRASFFTMRKVGRARPPLRRPTTGISPLQVDILRSVHPSVGKWGKDTLGRIMVARVTFEIDKWTETDADVDQRPCAGRGIVVSCLCNEQ